MPTVRFTKNFTKDDAEFLAWLVIRRDAFNEAIGEIIDRATRVEDVSSRNKPLAPRKPAGSRAKGKPAKGRKSARKVAHKG